MENSGRSYNSRELVSVMASRVLEDGKIVFVGAGIPLIAAALAQKTRAPHLTIVFEGGSVGPEIKPEYVPLSTNEMRAGTRAFMMPSVQEVFLFQQRGYVDYSFLGAAQIDKFGNINTTVIGSWDKPKVRLPGSGGANDLISSAIRTIVVTMHEKRRFVEKVDFVTSPGFLGGSESRRKSGLIFGGVYKIVTDLGIMGFENDDKEMCLEAVHSGVSVDDVLSNTGFKLRVSPDVKVTESPTAEELRILRSLDPKRYYI